VISSFALEGNVINFGVASVIGSFKVNFVGHFLTLSTALEFFSIDIANNMTITDERKTPPR
jgi:large-conductance mechanosensitive channel